MHLLLFNIRLMPAGQILFAFAIHIPLEFKPRKKYSTRLLRSGQETLGQKKVTE